MQELSGVVIIENGKILLLKRKKHDHFEFPGGKIEPGETKEQAAVREAKEEIGCAVELIRYVGANTFVINAMTYKGHKFLARILPGEQPRLMEQDEFSELFWMPMLEYQKYPVATNVKEFCETFLMG
jgi:8-oxo-dGTP diphosphatase